MSISPNRPACIDPDLGEAAAQDLGRVPSQAVEIHRATCTACELERLAFESLDAHAVDPSPALRAWVRTVARALHSRSS